MKKDITLKRMFLFLIIPIFSYSSFSFKDFRKPTLSVVATGLFAITVVNADNKYVRTASALCMLTLSKISYDLLTGYSARQADQIWHHLNSHSFLNSDDEETDSEEYFFSSESSSGSDFVEDRGPLINEVDAYKTESFVKNIARAVDRKPH